MTKDALIDNEVLKRAIVRSLEIIGEATKKIPANIKCNNHYLTWQSAKKFIEFWGKEWQMLRR